MRMASTEVTLPLQSTSPMRRPPPTNVPMSGQGSFWRGGWPETCRKMLMASVAVTAPSQSTSARWMLGVGVGVGGGEGVGVGDGVFVGVGDGVGVGVGVLVGVGAGVGVGVPVGFGVGGGEELRWTHFATEGTPLPLEMN